MVTKQIREVFHLSSQAAIPNIFTDNAVNKSGTEVRKNLRLGFGTN